MKKKEIMVMNLNPKVGGLIGDAHKIISFHSSVRGGKRGDINKEGRSYLYQIAKRKTVFCRHYAWWVKDPLKVPVMREASTLLDQITNDQP